MTNFTFTTREEYLAYRANWRELYKGQSFSIRNLKQLIRESEAGPVQSRLQSQLAYARIEANRMNLELAEAKKFAAAQRAARLPQAA